MPVLLPIAGVSINLILLLGIGTLIGVLSGLFGVGGGFLLTPLLMMVGITPTVAAASGLNAVVATSSSGVGAHFRLGNVDVKLGSVLLAGALAGAGVGVRFTKLLRTMGDAGLVITLAYIVVLGSAGTYMFLQSLQALRRGALVPKRTRQMGRFQAFVDRLPWRMKFPHSQVEHSLLVPLFLAAVVGILSAVMGVGGGFIMIPIMVYLLGMPTHVAVGTSLFQVLFTCVGATYMHATANYDVDLVLALLLAVGSAIGAQFGARLSRFLRGEQLMILLAILVLIVVVQMVVNITMAPPTLLQAAAGAH
jgi:uncharacterized membrane protein YfcA